MNVARSRKEHKPYLRWTRLLASTQPFEPRSCLVVELPSKAARPLLDPRGLPELVREGRGGDLGHLHARRVLQRRVARHEHDVLTPAVLGGEPLEERVGVRRVTDLERAAAGELAEAGEGGEPA